MNTLDKLLAVRNINDDFPYVVKQRRVYILPTKSGLLFSSMLFIMFLVSLNNNNNLGLLLTFLLCSMFLTSMIYTHSNLLGLKILSLSSKPVFSGEKLEVACSVFSATFARPLVAFKLPYQEKTIEKIDEAVNKFITLNADKLPRGRYRPKTLIIETEFPFSFFRAWTYLETEFECLIYPSPLANSYQGTTLEENSEIETELESSKGTEDFHGLRTYQAGDPLRQIYWKGFSRGGGLHSKTYSGGCSKVIMFDFDSIPETDTEKRLSMLSYLVLTQSKAGSRFALKMPGKTIGPDAGEMHVNKCLKALALFGELNV